MKFKEYALKMNGEMMQSPKVCFHVIEFFFQIFSILNRSHTHNFSGSPVRKYSKLEMYLVEFTAFFNQRRKKTPTQLYNILSVEIDLSSSTLTSFY